jgi:chemotaxis protein MotB
MKKPKIIIIKGAPAWVVTFGDLMSLLLTFFVLLLSFSKITSPQQYVSTFGNVQQAFGLQTDVRIKPPGALDMIAMNPDPNFNAKALEKTLNESVVPRFPPEDMEIIQPEVVRTMDRVTLRFNGDGMFPSGQKLIDPRYYGFLDEVASRAAKSESNLLVEAHTDSRPFRNRLFRSNLDLSAARSARVINYLINSEPLDVNRVLALGKGAYEPVFPNTTKWGRQKNRRIEISFVERMKGSESQNLKQDDAARIQAPGDGKGDSSNQRILPSKP